MIILILLLAGLFIVALPRLTGAGSCGGREQCGIQWCPFGLVADYEPCIMLTGLFLIGLSVSLFLGLIGVYLILIVWAFIINSVRWVK